MLDILFLGTSAGVPTVERGMPCIALRWQGKLILWDVGECCQRALMERKAGYGSIEQIFISHLHLDHFLGLYGLVETLRMVVGKERLHIHAPEGLPLINKWPFMELHSLREGYSVEVGDGAVVKAFRVKHEGPSFGFLFQGPKRRKFYAEKAHALGLRGEMFREIQEKGWVEVNGRKIALEEVSYLQEGIKVAYSGDTTLSKNIAKWAKGADVLIHEATFHSSLEKEARERKHSTAEMAGLIAKEASVKHLILTHISARYKGQEELLVEDARKHYDGPITVARDGMLVRVGKGVEVIMPPERG